MIPRGVDLEIFDPTRVGAQRIIKPCPPMAAARRHACRDASRPADAMEGRARFHSGSRELGRREMCCVLAGVRTAPGFRSELEAAIDAARARRPLPHCRGMPGHAGRLHAGRCRRLGIARPRGVRPRHRRSAGDGPAGRRHRSRRRRETIVPGSPAGSCRRASLPRSRPRSVTHCRSSRGAAAACERSIAHIAARYTREAMCAGTIRVYEELLFRDRQETSTMVLAGALPTA